MIIKAAPPSSSCHMALCKHEVVGRCACLNPICVSHEYVTGEYLEGTEIKKIICVVCRWKVTK
jgi:hypothetical protein